MPNRYETYDEPEKPNEGMCLAAILAGLTIAVVTAIAVCAIYKLFL